jgi:tRNA1Val (adenine37-N6)-methyltransferase
MARQRQSLPFDQLLSGASKLLTTTGIFAVIIPYAEEASFIRIAKDMGLHVFKITRVKGTPGSDLKRSLLAFSFKKKELREDELVIETDRHQYTEAYMALTRDFYLKM